MATPHVAIIGSGLAGLSLALALHQQSIPCTLYESRASPLNIGGAVMLSPNALKILDALGLYASIRHKGYNFSTLEYKDGSGNLLESYEFGDEAKYGYAGLRIYRTVLIDTLLEKLKEEGVKVMFGKKFVRVLVETEKSVRWEFDDGTVEEADILVGADGIHSTVRKYLYPDLKTIWTGMAGITATIPTSQAQVPEGYHIPATISNQYGGFTLAPQQVDGSECLIGKQKRIVGEEPSRADWERITADKEALVKFLQQDAEHFPPVWQNAVSDIPLDKINVWPFYIVPKLEHWASEKRRVIILGDAAHAIPPSAGQGISQAFEDVYILALLVAQIGKEGKELGMQTALSFWQEYRQARVEKVLWLNRQIEIRRMTQEERERLPPGSREEFELGWLFDVDFKRDVESWVSKQR